MEQLLQEKNAPLFELVSRERVRTLLNEEALWPWYGQLMRQPQTIAYLLQINSWLQQYQVELLFWLFKMIKYLILCRPKHLRGKGTDVCNLL